MAPSYILHIGVPMEQLTSCEMCKHFEDCKLYTQRDLAYDKEHGVDIEAECEHFE